MSSVVVYFEGGGNRAHGKVSVRRGLKAFLEAFTADARAIEIVVCGSTVETIRRWAEHPRAASEVALLLVDADEAVVTESSWQHLCRRYGGLPASDRVRAERCHLMVCVTETWIVADPQALASYCRADPGLRLARLPAHADLEALSKRDVLDALAAATRETRKPYDKIEHGPKLLALANPATVRTRCPHAAAFLDAVAAALAA